MALHRCDLRHNRHHSLLLQRSWNKYGESAFEFKILEKTTIELLDEAEQKWIEQLKPVFNASLSTNRHCLGRKNGPPSEETKAKIRAKVTGFRHTEETKAKLSAARRGKRLNLSPEKRQLRKEQGKIVARIPYTEERRQAVSEFMKHRPHSEENLKKRSESLKGKPWSDARREAEKTKNRYGSKRPPGR
jgi:group I intron endonuclease